MNADEVELPHVRVGSGPNTLIVLEGLGLENAAPTGTALRAVRWAWRPFTRRYTVYQVTRKPNLSQGTSTKDMASMQAAWMEARFDRPVDVMGLSTGGHVAQHLAASHQPLVRRLVLSDTACRLSDESRRLMERLPRLAASGRAADAQLEITRHMDMGALGGLVLRLMGRRLFREPADPSDYIRTIEADLNHDACEQLSAIQAPTLVIGGTADFFYSEDLLRETAERVPSSSIRLFSGTGHGVGKTHRREFQRDVLEFLSADGRRPDTATDASD